MKKFLKIFSIIVLSVFLLLLALPFFFKGKIEKMINEEISKNVNAKVEYKDFSLSLIRNFPNIHVHLDGLTVSGKDKFEGDTLLAIDRFAVIVDVSSVFSDVIDVNEILIDHPYVHAKVLPDSTANWDIMIDTGEAETEPEDTTSSDMGVRLHSFRIVDGKIVYNDTPAEMLADIDGFNLALTGDLSAKTTDLDFNAGIDHLTVRMEDVNYLKGAKVGLDAKVKADMEKMLFTFLDNEFTLNGLALGIEGYVQQKDSAIGTDLVISAKKSDLKTLLALVPEVYMKDFEEVSTSGNFSFVTKIKGDYVDSDNLPAFNVELAVTDGKVQYPDLPKSIDDINIRCVVDNPGGAADNTVTDIEKFHFKLAGNPFNAGMRITHPVTNLAFNGNAVGKIDLGSLSDAIPIDSFTIKGVVTTDIAVAGNYEMIEKEEYEKIKSTGNVSMKGFFYSDADFPEGVHIDNAEMTFSPRYLTLKSFKSRLGQSDFNMTGKLENYLAYVLKDGTLKGSLNHHSNFINANELMAMSSEDTASVDSTSAELVIVPKNIDFVLNSKIDKILYDKLVIDHTQGKITIRDGKVVLDGLDMALLGGSMKLTGEYSTENISKPFVDFFVKANNLDINKAANSFSIVDSVLPIAKYAAGRVSAGFNYFSLLNDKSAPVLSSVNGNGLLRSSGIEISGSKIQNGIAALLKNDKYKKMLAKDLNIDFVIDKGNLIVKPFTVNVYNKKIKVQGRQGVDKTMDYKITLPLSRKDLAGIAGLLGGVIPSKGPDVPVDVIIRGTFDDPRITLDLDQAKAALGKELEKEADKAIDNLVKDKEVQKQLKDIKKKLGNIFK